MNEQPELNLDGLGAMVMGAGFGTRMRPLSASVPKPAVPVMGRPLIGYTLLGLRSLGLADVVVNTHHLGPRLEAILDSWADRRLHGCRIHYARETEGILGTGGGLVAARDRLPSGPIIGINGDVLHDIDFEAVLRAHRQSGALATMVGFEDPRARTYGALRRDAGGRLRVLAAHAECPGDWEATDEHFIYTGVHIMEPEVFDLLPPRGESCIVRQGYGPALARGANIHLHAHRGTWLDLGNPAGYLDAHLELFRGGLELPLASIPDAMKDDLWARALYQEFAWASGSRGAAVGGEHGIVRAPDVTIEPPFAFGAGVQLHEGARVSGGCVLAPGTVVGAGARLTRVITWAGVQIAPGAVLSDCVVARIDGEQRVVDALPPS